MLPASMHQNFRQRLLSFGLAASLIAFAIAQLAAASVGSAPLLGALWSWVAVVAMAALGFALPVMIGAFVGALRVWHWHWSVAAIFAAPRLVTVLPGLVAAVLAKLRHG